MHQTEILYCLSLTDREVKIQRNEEKRIKQRRNAKLLVLQQLTLLPNDNLVQLGRYDTKRSPLNGERAVRKTSYE